MKLISRLEFKMPMRRDPKFQAIIEKVTPTRLK